MALLRWTLQVRSVPERLLEWVLLLVPPSLFEAGLRRFGFDAKRYTLDGTIFVTLAALAALGAFALRRGWPSCWSSCRGSHATPTPTPLRPITRVVIPRISLDAPAVPVGLVNRDGAITWDVPAFKIGHAEETAGAGDPGNAVLAGHVTSRNLSNVFEHLHQLDAGDVVQVFSADQEFEYRVASMRHVGRDDVSVVQPTAAPSVTLITCTGTWLPLVNDYAERLAVRADLAD
jgi:LPXTG-site transpeptidase (sortase) family protein